MAISLLQTKSLTNAASSPSTVALSTTTTGSLVIVGTVYGAAGHGTGLITSITCTGMSFTKILDVDGTANGLSEMSLWYAFNITGATTPTLTINWNSSFADISAVVREYSGLDTTAPLDKSASATGASVNASSGATVTTTAANELVVGIVTDDWGTGQTYTVGSGYGNLTSIINTGSYDLSLEDKIVAATGTQTATLTLGNSAGWVAGVATFKAAAGGTLHTSSLTATLSTSGSITKAPKLPLTAALRSSGALTKRAIVRLLPSGALSFSGTLTRTVTRTLSGILTSAGSVVGGHLHFLTLTATLAFSAPGTNCDYLTIQDSLATGAAYAGKNSILVSNDTNWSVG